MKKSILVGLMMLITASMQATSLAPAEFQGLYQRISDATNNMQTILFDTKTGIIAHSKELKPTKATLDANEQAFQDAKSEIESALYKLLDHIAASGPSKNFHQDWSFDVPNYPIIEEQQILQPEYENLMNAFHGVLNKEKFCAHFFELWVTNNYEDHVIGLFYDIGQDLVARSINDMAYVYYGYVDRVKELYSIK